MHCHCNSNQDFRKGMHLYLSRHEYKNTFTEDLWAALGEASRKPIKAIMSTWTKQMGFPVLKVSPNDYKSFKTTRGNDFLLKSCCFFQDLLCTFLIDRDSVYLPCSLRPLLYFVTFNMMTNTRISTAL